MNRYKKYKPSGIDWIGEIPDDWELNKIKYCATINDDVLSETTDENMEMNYVDISSIKKGNIDKKETLKFVDAPSRARRKVKSGDIIVSTVRTYLKAIARVSNPENNLIVSTGFAVIRPKQINSDYLGNLFLSEHLIGEIISRSVGVSYPAINSSQIGDIKIPCPSKHDQTAIANYLDEKTAQIDKLIANKQKLIELLKEERTVFINEAVSGKGKNWEKKKLKYITEKIGDGIHATPEYTDFTDFFFVNGTNLNEGKIEFKELTRTVSEEEYLKLKLELKAGAVLLSLNGTIGKIAFYRDEKIILGKSVAFIECLKELYNLYAYYVLQSDYVQEYFENSLSGTTIRNLSLFTLRNTSIYLPGFKEQIQIVEQIQTETQRIDNAIPKIGKEIELTQEYRTALISEVVTGKIKVV